MLYKVEEVLRVGRVEVDDGDVHGHQDGVVRGRQDVGDGHQGGDGLQDGYTCRQLRTSPYAGVDTFIKCVHGKVENLYK